MRIWWLLCAVVDVCSSRDVGILLHEGKGAAISRVVWLDAVWRALACHGQQNIQL
jgi:hypothetical protein